MNSKQNQQVDKISLTSEQSAAVEMVQQNQVVLLTGGPGTGKTTTIRAILHWAKEAKLRVLLAAPSGKAAKRMSEATGYSASTIHKLLVGTFVNGEFYFKYNQNNPLETDLIIIDETSMIDNSLMANLLQAIKPGTKLLLVGDQDQLPSVGAGAVFRDLLASEAIPTVTLNIIHRNSGAIVKACHEIKHGRAFIPPAVLDLENGDNLRHIEESDQPRIIGIIRTLVQRMANRGYDPIWDVQILSPLNNRTIMSCDSINKIMQEALNPNTLIDGYKFKIGDKVINTKNAQVDQFTYIVNGDMGTVKDITTKNIVVHFYYPDRIVTLSRVENNLLLAYACTIHRYQGSEVPVTIIPIHRSFGFFYSRSLLYTAISRASEICITVGQFSAVKAAIKRTESNMRVTMLKTKLAA